MSGTLDFDRRNLLLTGATIAAASTLTTGGRSRLAQSKQHGR
jgi:hypothetical protein